METIGIFKALPCIFPLLESYTNFSFTRSTGPQVNASSLDAEEFYKEHAPARQFVSGVLVGV